MYCGFLIQEAKPLACLGFRNTKSLPCINNIISGFYITKYDIFGPEEALFEQFATEMALKQVVSPVIRAETACK